MLPKRHRFTSKLFERIRPKMKAYRSGDFLFLYQPSKHPSRFASVVSKKADKRAVKRNYLRRQLYQNFQTQILPEFPHINCITYYRGSEIKTESDLYKNAVNKFKNFLKKS